jgi:hypothetical protein
MTPISEQLTAQFYEWEQKGRGWQAFKESVDLEPHFHPFFFHRVKPPATFVDDGKRHTLFSWLGEAIMGKPKEEPTEDPYAWLEDDGTAAHLFECDEPLVTYSLHLPKGARIDVGATEQLLFMLSTTQYPLSFEIYGSATSISFQICCRAVDAVQVRSQIKAYFPECTVKEQKDRMDAILENEKGFAYFRYYGLKDEFMRPLKMADSFKPDPLTGLLGTLEHLQDTDHVVIQILFKGAINPWAESILRSVTDSDGKSFFENSPEMVPLAREKVSSPLFGVCMRVMVASATLDRAEYISRLAGSALGRIYFSESNSLIPIQSPLDFETNIDDIILRETHILGMLLNAQELATVVHLPSETVASEKLERDTRKTKAAPAMTEGHELILGKNEHQGKTKLVTVGSSTRMRHTHVIGATGTGKSTFILSLIAQDIQQGKGLAVLDPHGDLIESILTYIPTNHADDVILIDPADADFPVGFNILQAHSEIEKDILSSDLVAVFRRLSTSWGDQMNSVFANAILAILESKDGGTLVDLRRFLVEKPYREGYLKTVSDPNVVYYWQKEYPLLKSNSIGPILTRLDTFLRPKLIRNMVAQKKGLDFEHILDSGKILLVKLSQGLIGTENSYLLGTFFVTKMYQAAMARQIKAKADRQDYYLYIDEFQNFITPSMSQILSGARKYSLGMILAHQDMQQLQKYDNELASAVVANAGTRICFRLGDMDAKRFDSGFAYFEAKDLENLHTGEAIARIERSEYDFSLTTIPPKHIDEALAEQRKMDALQKSQEAYGTPKQEVEAALEALRGELLAEEPKEEMPVIRKKEALVEVSPRETTNAAIGHTPVSPSLENSAKKKEESQHRYLQALIKKMAESRGYATRIEEPTPDGKGRVDVHLERNGKRIAVEICNTTEAEWEVHNIQKCIAAGYDVIVACSNEKKSLDGIRKKAESLLDVAIQAKLQFFQPEQFFVFLDQELAKEASKEVRVKGYRVKVNYSAVSGDEAKNLSNSIVKTVTDATRKRAK